MKHRFPIFAFLVLLALLSSTSAAAADNPECLGSSCGRLVESGPLTIEAEGFLASLWRDLVEFFS